ncbi:MAG: cell envelope integrity protein TolA [Gammaproteobacteria bacterium]
MIVEAVAWIRKEAVPLGFAVLLHAALGALLIFGTGLYAAHPQDMPGPGSEHQPIQAVVVNEKDYQEAQTEIANAQKAREAHAQALKKEADQAESARKKAQQELANLKKQNASAAAQAVKQKQQVDALSKRAAAAEQTRKENEAKAAAAEKTRKAEEARLAKAKADAAAAAKKAAAEAAAKAEAQRKAQMQQELAAEAALRLSRARGNWIAAIRDKVTRNWNSPPSTPSDLDCLVQITQLANGQVVSAKPLRCNGDSAVQQSVITAIYKSSPLPVPDDPDAFLRQFKFDFVPGQNP